MERFRCSSARGWWGSSTGLLSWLNFSEVSKGNPGTLEKSLNRKLYDIAELYKVEDKINISVEEACEDYLSRVINLFSKLDHYEPTPIILIDEYDSPLISCEKEHYEEVLSVLSSFFKVLKGRQVAPLF
ncbi:AAA family ATPase [Cardinium endosymbiont of Nabis limbatus]|uniref:AAA family ATPase n=1 Tax=Cardinium endosymbiont of Nabis limbatus TaxID=3066217 RepID=UPI003AF381EB